MSEPPPLATTIEGLCDLIRELPAAPTNNRNPPKTHNVPSNTIYKIRALARELSRLVADQDPSPPPPPPSLDVIAIQTQLAALTTKVDALIAHSPASTAPSSGSSCPDTASASPRGDHVTARPASRRRDASLDIVVIPKSPDSPTLVKESPQSILSRLNERLNRHRILKGIGLTNEGYAAPVFRAVLPQPDGSLRLLVCTQSQADVLVERRDSWLPQCLPDFEYSHAPLPNGHTVVVHGVPTAIYHDSDNMTAVRKQFSLQNAHALTHSTLLNLHWLSRQPIDKLHASKVHSSLVLHVASKDIADQLVASRVSFNGTLYRTEHITLRPTKCYNCFRTGHPAAYCHHPAACGICAGPHTTSDCICPHDPVTCTDISQCPHIVPKCATPGCSGSHRSNDPACAAFYPTPL